MEPAQTLAYRKLYWNNVVRETLTSLSVESMRVKAAAQHALEQGVPADEARESHPAADLFDGRLAIITELGNRIAIADVFPLFACSIGGVDRPLSTAVQCSVFRIITPDGEMFTMPVDEIRCFHALSPELMKRIEALSQQADEEAHEHPFGFAAFASLANADKEQAAPE
ncbi:MAG: hypothetical protein KDA28_04920 [Phycisphaerales bacterium]|nr:hypothetical protein [Phycisphaerales bacterium]